MTELTWMVRKIIIEALEMTINKYFVFVPQTEEQHTPKDNNVVSEKETQRQALVKQAQQQGALIG
ncbi:hypothetical protein EJ063_00060 [Vibrio aquaticus]|uniref:Uncharacterized protein n=1 Tax=Vibrio aquaticus TaxID=2496559 RepID=A0A3S0QET4_9VIBR|nr:hypothetical protein [Vibrio aquaticus]RTZ17213.1 hypothetical protein EJ063_00060 [Vibrio aquaticus]